MELKYKLQTSFTFIKICKTKKTDFIVWNFITVLLYIFLMVMCIINN